MKNLHKKIGAMALAAMVVAGGVAVSGAQSFAAGYNGIPIEHKIKNEQGYKLVKKICDRLGIEILAAKQDLREMDRLVEEVFKERRGIRNRLIDRGQVFDYDEDIIEYNPAKALKEYLEDYIKKLEGKEKVKERENRFLRVEFDGISYILDFNKK